MKSILEVIRSGTVWLEQRGVRSARLNLEHLLAHTLGIERMQLYLRFDQPLDEDLLAPLREHMRRRAKGVPLQHLLGSVEFLSREFRCDGRALIPRPETEVLVQRCLKLDLPADARVLDLATGSGVIGLSLAAERPGWRVACSDVSPEALALARHNADDLDLTDRVKLIQGDLLSPLPAEPRLDLLVANLPYIPSGELAGLAREVKHDPVLALDGGADGLNLVRRLIAELPKRLAPGGYVALEVGHDQGAAVKNLLADAGLVDCGLWSDLEDAERFPHGRQPS